MLAQLRLPALLPPPPLLPLPLLMTLCCKQPLGRTQCAVQATPGGHACAARGRQAGTRAVACLEVRVLGLAVVIERALGLDHEFAGHGRGQGGHRHLWVGAPAGALVLHQLKRGAIVAESKIKLTIAITITKAKSNRQLGQPFAADRLATGSCGWVGAKGGQERRRGGRRAAPWPPPPSSSLARQAASTGSAHWLTV